MKPTIHIKDIFEPSEEIVFREIEGELILIPLVSGIGDMEEDLFTLNETGKAIWGRLDGKKTVEEIIQFLETEYDSPLSEIQKDVMGLINEFVKRKMVTRVHGR
jgi:hypothetical protein